MDPAGGAQKLTTKKRQTLKRLLIDLLNRVKFPNSFNTGFQKSSSRLALLKQGPNHTKWVSDVRESQKEFSEFASNDLNFVVEFNSRQAKDERFGEGTLEVLRLTDPFAGDMKEIECAFYRIASPPGPEPDDSESGNPELGFANFFEHLDERTQHALKTMGDRTSSQVFDGACWQLCAVGLDEARTRLINCLESWLSWLDSSPKPIIGDSASDIADNDQDEFRTSGVIATEDSGDYLLFSEVLTDHLPPSVYPTGRQLKGFLSDRKNSIRQGRLLGKNGGTDFEAPPEKEGNGKEIEDKKLESMILVCTAKKDLSWRKLEMKYDIAERTVRRWAETIGYDLSNHEFVSASAEVSALLDKKKNSKKLRSKISNGQPSAPSAN